MRNDRHSIPSSLRRFVASSLRRPSFLASSLLLLVASASQAQEKVTYQDHVLPLFRNQCLSCHDGDKKKAGLDLSNYAGAIAGGDNGAVINSGDPSGSKLLRVMTHEDEPTMPPKKEKLPEKELTIVRNWIAGGALETATGKPAVAVKPKVDLGSVKIAVGKPEGPIAMPKILSSDPIVRTSRPGAVPSIGHSPWAPVVAVGGQKQISLYHSTTLELLGVLAFDEGIPHVLKFSRNGNLLLAAGGIEAKAGKVVLFDVATGKRVTDVGDELDAILAADVTSDHQVVAFGGPSRLVKGYNVSDGQELFTIKKHTDWVTALSFSPDGVLLASGDRAGNLYVWEARSGLDFHNLTGHREGITSVAFRGDSNALVSASKDGTLKLWDMKEGKQIKSWTGHAGGVEAVAFTHDGRIVSSGRDKMVRLWTADGNAAGQLDPAFPDIALHATFDHEGKRAIAGDWSGQVRVWTVEDKKVAGELFVNPPTVDERLAAAEKALAEVTAAGDKAAAELKAAEDAANKAKADVDAAKAALDKMKGAAPELAAKAKAAEDALKAANESLTKAKATLAEKEKAASSGAAASPVAQLETELKVAEADVAEKKATLAEGEKRLAAAKEAVAKSNGDATAKAEQQAAQESRDRRVGRLEVSTRARDAKAAELKAARENTPGAPAVADADVKALREKVTSAEADVKKADDALKAARDAMAKSAPSLDQATKDITAKEAAAADAAKKLELQKLAVAPVVAKASAARWDVAKLKAAKAGSTLHAAKLVIDQRDAALKTAKDAVEAAGKAKDETAKAVVDFDARVKQAPQKITQLTQQLEPARVKVTEARGPSEAAAMGVQDREALVLHATELVQKVSSLSLASKDNKPLADAVTQAKAALESLNTDLAAAKEDAAKKADALAQATGAVEAMQKELSQLRSDQNNAGPITERLKKAAADAVAAIPKRQQEVDAANKALEEAKAKIAPLQAEYDRLTQEAGKMAPAEATASATK